MALYITFEDANERPHTAECLATFTDNGYTFAVIRCARMKYDVAPPFAVIPLADANGALAIFHVEE